MAEIDPTGSNPAQPEPPVAIGLRGYRTLDPDRSAGRRREILHAAARVFARSGYYAATTDDIAHEMGVTKGVVYYYFRAKEDIFVEVVTTAIEGAQRRLEDVLADPGRSVDLLRKAIAVHIEYNLNADEEGYYAMLVVKDLKALSRERRAEVRAIQSHYTRTFEAIIRRGIADGSFIAGEPFLMAITIITAANAVSDWYRHGERLSMQDVIDQVAEQLVRGVLI